MPFYSHCLFFLAGLWIFSFYLGNFVGPTVSGLMVQWIGFRRTAAGCFTKIVSKLFFRIFLCFSICRFLPLHDDLGPSGIRLSNEEKIKQNKKTDEDFCDYQ